MRIIAEFLISIADLLEAEGKLLKQNLSKFMMAGFFLAVSMLIAIAAIGLIICSIYLAFAATLGAPWAAFLSGLITLLFATVLFVSARMLTR